MEVGRHQLLLCPCRGRVGRHKTKSAFSLARRPLQSILEGQSEEALQDGRESCLEIVQLCDGVI